MKCEKGNRKFECVVRGLPSVVKRRDEKENKCWDKKEMGVSCG